MLRLALLAILAASPAAAAPCGGSFSGYLETLQAEAVARGHDPAKAARFFNGLKQDPKVLRADKAQGVFQLDFITFSRRLITSSRLKSGAAAMQREDAIFTRIARDHGVPRGILTAFWTFETDLGRVQGDFNTANALATLGHDCRRPELFQPQIFAALTLHERGDFDPATTTGAWAGEIGMVQMLPADILKNGADGDGDGHVSLKTSAPDALLSGARMLAALGWQPNQPWLQEVTVPDTLDWRMTGTDTALPVADWLKMGVRPRSGEAGPAGLPASLLLPVGRHGPAFLAYPNFKVLFEWNQSYTYVLTAAYFATRLEGAPIFDAGTPDPGLDQAGMKALQTALTARGENVGAIDGILGSATRAAVQKAQAELGLPADAWPTPDLLKRLR